MVRIVSRLCFPGLGSLCLHLKAGLNSAVDSLWIQGSQVSIPARPNNLHRDHEIISSVILPFPLIQEGHLLVSGEGIYDTWPAQEKCE